MCFAPTLKSCYTCIILLVYNVLLVKATSVKKISEKNNVDFDIFPTDIIKELISGFKSFFCKLQWQDSDSEADLGWPQDAVWHQIKLVSRQPCLRSGFWLSSVL